MIYHVGLIEQIPRLIRIVFKIQPIAQNIVFALFIKKSNEKDHYFRFPNRSLDKSVLHISIVIYIAIFVH